MASLSDNFGRSDGEIGADWTEDSGDIDIVSEQAVSQNVGDNVARYTASALDSVDHYCECDVILGRAGPVARKASATQTYYHGRVDSANTEYDLYKVEDGAFSLLGSGGDGSYATLKLTVDSATQSLEADDVEVVSDTDPDIEAGLYAGMRHFNEDNEVDNWAAADLNGATTTTSSSTTSSSTSSTASTTSTTHSTTTSSSTSSTASTTTSSSTTSSSSSTSSTASTTSTTTPGETTTSSSTTSSSTTSTSPPVGYAFGEQNPTEESAESWATWSNGAAGSPEIVGDADWGKLKVETGAIGHSAVKDRGSVKARMTVVKRDKYGSGSGSITIYIRGQATTFNQDDGSPSWEEYTTPVKKDWRFIQAKVEYAATGVEKFIVTDGGGEVFIVTDGGGEDFEVQP